MSRTNWKGLERAVAKDLGVKKVGNTGESTADVVVKMGRRSIYIECKNRKNINIREELEKVSKKRRDLINDFSALVYKKTNSRKNAVFMKAEDFVLLEKSSLLNKDIIIELQYEDFINLVNNC